jgi:hypothetical protein
MKIGHTFKFRGQRYTCVDRFEIEHRTDYWIPILELESRCPTCGAAFSLTASRTQIRKRSLVRRCRPCRQLRLGPVEWKPPARKPSARKPKKKQHRLARGKPRPRPSAPRLELSRCQGEVRQPQTQKTHQAPEVEQTYAWALGMLLG